MVAAQGVAPRATTTAGNPAPAMMETTALAGLAVLRVPQASPVLLQAATLLVVAAASPHAVVSAWGWWRVRPPTRPGEAREGVRLSSGGSSGFPAGRCEASRTRFVFCSSLFLHKEGQQCGAPRGRVWVIAVNYRFAFFIVPSDYVSARGWFPAPAVGATDPGPVFVSRCPRGTDWRGAPARGPGREPFE